MFRKALHAFLEGAGEGDVAGMLVAAMLGASAEAWWTIRTTRALSHELGVWEDESLREPWRLLRDREKQMAAQ